MKIVTILGARPQFIKASTVSRAIRSTGGVEEIIVHTGQHYDKNMSDIFFDELEIPKPDYCLGIGPGSHGRQTGRMLEAVEQSLKRIQPDFVLVYGDTNSTLAGALAAAKLHIPVAHVESGLRSYNRDMPEEINRVVTDHIATLLFAPTTRAADNLKQEGIPEATIAQVGDVMYDAALYYGTQAERQSRILHKLGLPPMGYVLATVHRAVNTDTPSRLQAIFEGLFLVANEIPVIIPLHPRTRAALERNGLLGRALERLCLTEPLGYLDMLMLERNATLIATDSGGMQKESFFYRVPCATLREETEWVELLEMGWSRLVPPTSGAAVFEAIMDMRGRRGYHAAPYGDGNAAHLIDEALRATYLNNCVASNFS